MIIFLVEDYSMRKFLEGILPRLGFASHHFEIKHHNGKEDLLANLSKVIPTLSKRAAHLIVLIDKDKQDCVQLKQKLQEKMAWCFCQYTLRIACYELESWFLGDLDAIAHCSSNLNWTFLKIKRNINILTILPSTPLILKPLFQIGKPCMPVSRNLPKQSQNS